MNKIAVTWQNWWEDPLHRVFRQEMAIKN